MRLDDKEQFVYFASYSNPVIICKLFAATGNIIDIQQL